MSGFYTPGLPLASSTNFVMPLTGAETYPFDTNKSQGIQPETAAMSGNQMGAIGVGAENFLGSFTGGTMILDCSQNSFFRVVLATTGLTLQLLNPSPGQLVAVEVVEDGTGSRTITTYQTRLGTATAVPVKWNAGTTPTLSTAAGATDRLEFRFGFGMTTVTATAYASGVAVAQALA